MIHKNWAELIKPTQLDVKPGNDPLRQAVVTAEPLERGFGLTLGNALRRVLCRRCKARRSPAFRSTTFCMNSHPWLVYVKTSPTWF